MAAAASSQARAEQWFAQRGEQNRKRLYKIMIGAAFR
jgi:hypothetical protein